MTTDQTPAEPTTQPWAAAVAAVAAALTTLHRTPGGDFPEGLSLAVATAAANAGGLDALTASRPGSWEADQVQQLLTSTVGEIEADLWRYRTEPVRIPFNARDYFEGSGFLSPDEFEMRLEDERLSPLGTTEALPNGGILFTPYDEDAYNAATEAVGSLVDEYTARYTAEAAAYTGRLLLALDEVVREAGLGHVGLEVDDAEVGPSDQMGALEERLLEAAQALTVDPDLPKANS